MPIQEIISQSITGIDPFNELPVDAEIWRQAHGQHHLHRFLHAAAAHRPGIVYGLDVVVSATKDRTLVVAPGVGVDSEGRTLLATEAATFEIKEKGQTYIVIFYEDTWDRKSAIRVGSGEKPYRLVEGRQLVATRELPKTPHLELARIDRSRADAPIRPASDPFDPAEDELNLNYRSLAFPHCVVDASIGELCFLPAKNPSAWKPNRAGLCHLLREGSTRGFHLDFSGLFNLRAPGGPREPVLLYVAGSEEFQPITDEQLEGLRRFLSNSGTILGEAVGGSQEFAKGFQELANKLGAKLGKSDKVNPLLNTHYVFSAPPPGTNDNGTLTMDADAGVILSTYDYGGAWGGRLGKGDTPGGRERIRTAQEFGLNIVTFAARRKWMAELSRLG